jgi:predicted transcriptional regulator
VGNLVEEFGISFAEAARQLGVSTSVVSKIISRTENINIAFTICLITYSKIEHLIYLLTDCFKYNNFNKFC